MNRAARAERAGPPAGHPPAGRPVPRHGLPGHTLTELLVVLAILSLFAVIAFPRFITAYRQSRLRAAMDAVRQDLVLTRARAVGTGVRHQLLLDPETRTITVQPYRPELEVAGGAPSGDPSLQVLRDTLPEDISVSRFEVAPLGFQGAPSGEGQPLTFYPEGRGDSASIVLENEDGDRLGVRIDGFSGEIRDMTEEELR